MTSPQASSGRNISLTSGTTSATERHQVGDFPYRPTRIVDSIADVVPLVSEMFLPEDA